MPDIQLSRSEPLNNQFSNDQNLASLKNKNQSASRVPNKKPANKCLQNNLIYAMYLPLLFEDQQMVKSQNHFGKYGNIETIIYTAGSSAKGNDQEAEHIQAYITFNNEKEAAMAIVAVNDIHYDTKTIRTTYGTNRMCNSFYSGGKCTVRNCFYLHDQKKCINIQGPLKTDFDKQKIIAEQIVKKNLNYYIIKIEQLKQGNQKPGSTNRKAQGIVFPSIQQAISKLIERNVITQATYKQAYQQYLNTKKKMSQSVKKIEYIRYKKKPEPTAQYLARQNISSKFQISNKQSNLKENLWIKRSIPSTTKQLKCQFLMTPIIKSLDHLTNPLQKKTVYIRKPVPVKAFQIVGKTLEPLSIYWQFLDQKDDCKSDQLQTQESETQVEHFQEFPALSMLSNKNSIRKYSSPQFPSDDCNVLTRLKEEINKNPLIKKSRLEFAKTTSVLQKKKQYEKVTELLKNSLIK